jgi:hypothetical protein
VLLNIQDYWGVNAVSWSAWPSTWRYHCPLECQELFNQLYSIISQKNWCFSSPFIDKIFLGDQLCQFRTEFQLIRDLLIIDVAGCLRLLLSVTTQLPSLKLTLYSRCATCVLPFLYTWAQLKKISPVTDITNVRIHERVVTNSKFWVTQEMT